LSSPGSSRPPILVLVLAAAFLLLVTSLLIGSFVKPEFPPYELTRGAATGGVYTLDASAGDRWRRFRFAHDSLVETGDWDIAFRRNHVITAPGVGARDLGPVSFDSVASVPADGYATVVAARDTTNPAIGKWYAYSMLSHLLTSKHHVYAVRTSDGQFVVFEVLAYYCQAVGAGCYTMRYKTTRPRTSESPGARL
jgi:hypothetical protein